MPIRLVRVVWPSQSCAAEFRPQRAARQTAGVSAVELVEPGHPRCARRSQPSAIIDWISGLNINPTVPADLPRDAALRLSVADNGSDMYFSGTMDLRRNNDLLKPAFRALAADDSK